MIRCPDCDTTGRGVSCARTRCYCGHGGCWAYDSWVDLRARNAKAPVTTDTRQAESWANRGEGSTWIDQL